MRFWFLSGLVLLTGLFMYLRFPYERLAERISREVEASSGWKVQIVGLAARPTLLGPGLAAGRVRAENPGGFSIDVDEVVVRPAWSMSWLKFSPALALDLSADGTQLDGILTFSNPPHFDGSLVDADLAALGAEGGDRDLNLTGRANAELDLALEKEGPQGAVQLTAREGSFSHPLMPIAIPFNQVDAELELGGEAWLSITRSEIQSPLLSGQATGTVGTPPGGPIQLALDLEPSDAAAAALAQQGIRAGRDGRIKLQVSGTAANPRLR